jgi:hypothetical protein
MADTTTTNYALTKPEEFASTNDWGGKLNTDLDLIDTAINAAKVIADASVPATRTLGSSGGSITGLGALSGDLLAMAVAPNTTTQKIEVAKADSIIATRKQINFVDGAFITVLVEADGADPDVTNVTITGVDSETEITEALATEGEASSIARTGFDGLFVTTTPATLATVPAGRNSIKTEIAITNNSATAEGLALWIVPSGGAAADANKVQSDDAIRIKAGETLRLSLKGHVLGAGVTIVGSSETGSTILSAKISMVTVPTSNAAFIEGTPTLLTTSLQTLITVGAQSAYVAWIAHNLGTTEEGYTVAYRPSGAGGDSAAYNVRYGAANKLKPGQTAYVEAPDVLAAGDLLRVSASANSKISFRPSIVEVA